jgi:hypothetical protein
VSDRGVKSAADAYVHRLDGEFLCDGLALIVQRLRELIHDSPSHSQMVFLSSADDIICDLLEAVDGGWPAIEEIAGDLKT